MKKLALALLFLVFGASQSWAWKSVGLFGFDIDSTHHKISERAISMISSNHPSEYPDVTSYYGNRISNWSSGLADDMNAHGQILDIPYTDPRYGDTGHALDFDGGPYTDWDDNMRARYLSLDFVTGDSFFGTKSAYYYLGLMVHLIEDQAVPSHSANILHGGLPGDRLELRAWNKVPNTNTINFFTDSSLKYYHDNDPQSIILSVQTKLSGWTYPKDWIYTNSAAGQYWKENPTHKYVGTEFDSNWGSYGWSGTDVYTLGNPLPPSLNVDAAQVDSPNIVYDQLNAAASQVAGLLMAVSKSLPPLVKDLAADRIQFRAGSPIQVHFRILENRTQNVTYSARVYDSGGNIRDTPIWKSPVTLYSGNDLPWEKYITFDYDGRNANGNALLPGSYTLEIQVTDGDGNTTPGGSNYSMDFTVLDINVPNPSSINPCHCGPNPPSITGGDVPSIVSDYSAVIEWSTDRPANQLVYFGKNSTAERVAGTADFLSTYHSVYLSYLDPNTDYLYQIQSETPDGSVISDTFTFRTSADMGNPAQPNDPPTSPPDNTAPVITNVKFSEISIKSVLVTWDTDDLSSSQIDYGINDPSESQTAIDPQLTRNHSVLLYGLDPGTAYVLRVRSENDSLLSTDSADYSFTTLTPLTSPGAWFRSGSLYTEVYNPQLLPLPDQTILILGGGATTQIYDPNSESCVPVPSPKEEGLDKSVALANGKILAVGYNVSLDGRVHNVAEIYNPALREWSGTGTRNEIHRWYGLTLLSDGNVLESGGEAPPLGFFAGSAMNTCEIYDAKAGTWKYTGSMKEPRLLHTATLLANGNVLVTGGIGSDLMSSNPMSSCEVYIASAGYWLTVPSMKYPRQSHTAVLMQDGRVLVPGAPSEIYDPVSNSWSIADSMNYNRGQFSAILLKDGKVLAVGGAGLKSEVYDPTLSRWALVGDMAEEYRAYGYNPESAAIYLPSSNKVLAVGSHSGFSQIFAQDEMPLPPSKELIFESPPIHAQTHNHPIRVKVKITDPAGTRIGIKPRPVLHYKNVGSGSFDQIFLTAVSTFQGGAFYYGDIRRQMNAGQVLYYFDGQDLDGNISSYPRSYLKNTPYEFLRFNVVLDIIPPVVSETNPQRGAQGVSLTQKIEVKFSELMDSSTLTMDKFIITDATGTVVPIQSITVDPEGQSVIIDHRPFNPETIYVVSFSNAILDLSGNSLNPAQASFQFKSANGIAPLVTGLSYKPAHFSSSVGEMVFSSTFSIPVGEVRLILTNLTTNTTYSIVDNAGTKTGPSSYHFVWDGTLNGSPIPEGEYLVRMEARDRIHGLLGFSDSQPFNWLVRANATVEPSFEGPWGIPNINQTISSRQYSWTCGNINIGGGRIVEYNMGGTYGGTYTYYVFAGEKVEVRFGCGTIHYKNFYENPIGPRFGTAQILNNDFYLSQDFQQSSGTVSVGSSIAYPISITLIPPSTYGKENFQAKNVDVSQIHIVQPASGNDFDDNADVQTDVTITHGTNDHLDGFLTAKNISPNLPSFLIDRTSPTFNLTVVPEAINSAAARHTAINLNAFDNLPFPLLDLGLIVRGSNGLAVKTFVDPLTSTQTFGNFIWDGKDDSGGIVPNGIYFLTGSVSDKAGNRTVVQKTITIDSLPPQVVSAKLVAFPASHPNESVFNSKDDHLRAKLNLLDNLSPWVNIELEFRAQDGTSVLNHASSFSVTNTAKLYVLDFDLKDAQGNFLSDGSYHAVLRIMDQAGNQTALDLPDFRVDRVAPVVVNQYLDNAIFSPDDGPLGTGDGNADSVTLFYTLSEPGFASVEIQDTLGRTLKTDPVIGGLTTTGNYIWDGTAAGSFLADGAYILRLKSVDDVGNESIASIGVIKNMLPAQIVFPASPLGSLPPKVAGVVSLKGIALDPVVNDTAAFESYQLWIREGDNIDFSLLENNPAIPDTSIWHPISVPAGNQSAGDPQYPDSNVSYRSVLNSVIGTLDVSAYAPGSRHTILLVTRDKFGRTSFASQVIEIDPLADISVPVAQILAPIQSNPPLAFNVISGTETLSIQYSLTLGSGKKTDSTLEMFQMNGPNAFGPIVFRREFLGQNADSSGSFYNEFWDGKDGVSKKLVPGGLYKLRLTARDTDGMGVSSAECDLEVSVSAGGQLKITRFESLNASVPPGIPLPITCRVNKDSTATLVVTDLSGQVIQTLLDSAAIFANQNFIVDFSNNVKGLYVVKLTASDSSDAVSAEISISVDNGAVSAGNASINFPANGSIVQGETHYNWTATASGTYNPPQNFTSNVSVSGKETIPVNKNELWSDSTALDFVRGLKDNIVVDSTLGDGAIRLADGDSQFQATYENGVPSIYVDCYTATHAQSFSFAKGRQQIRNVDFYYTVFPGHSYRIEIRKDNGSGAPLDSAITGLDVQPTANLEDWLSADFTTLGIFLENNTQYWAILSDNRAPVWTGESSYMMGSYSADLYPKGSARLRWQGDPGCDKGWELSYVKDCTFRIITSPYVSSGTYVSQPIDAGLFLKNWGTFQAAFGENPYRKYYLQVSDDAINWDPEISVNKGSSITAALKRYIRWKSDLFLMPGDLSPTVDDVKISYKTSQNLTQDFGPFSKNISDVVWAMHPLWIGSAPDGLFSLFQSELLGRNVTLGPNYATGPVDNVNVALSVTSVNGFPQIKAETGASQPWTLNDDSALHGGKIIGQNAVFNDDSNPQNFTLESPYDFSLQRLKSNPISASYPQVDMTTDAAIVNRYAFWKNPSGVSVDNPYVSIDERNSAWSIELQYPDGTPNDSLAVNLDLSKISNGNADINGAPIDVDDEFTVSLVPGSAPKSFVEIRGNVSDFSQGFEGYGLFYSKRGEDVWRLIKTSSQPVTSGGVLGLWNVTGLNGEYDLQLTMKDASGLSQIINKVTLGTFVPKVSGNGLPVTARAPYNKAYLEFPSNSLDISTVVTITPVKFSDAKVLISSSLPQPIGALFEMQPSGIRFQKDFAGNVLSPAKLVTRFLPEELKGTDPGQLTLYSIKDDGSLDPLDARITYDANGNGVLDPDEVVTVESPVTHFSYVFAIQDIQPPVLDPVPASVTVSTLQISGTSEPSSVVNIFVNGALSAYEKAGSDGKFTAAVSLIKGSNRIDATATRILNSEGITRTSLKSKDLSVSLVQGKSIPYISSPSSGTVVSSTVTLIGFAMPDSVVELYGNSVFKDSGPADNLGQFQIYPSSPFLGGSQRMTLTNIASDGHTKLYSAPVTLSVDAVAPMTTVQRTLSVNSVKFSLVAVDPLQDGFSSGVRSTWFRTDSGPFLPFIGETSVSGNKIKLDYFSIDTVGNQEPIKSVTLDDTVAPDPVVISVQNAFNDTGLVLRWVSSGDDAGIGQAARYVIAYSTFALNSANFDQATIAVQYLTPNPAGFDESYTVQGLDADTHYYLAVKVFDAAGNGSALSNVVSLKTLVPDRTPPSISVYSPIKGALLSQPQPLISIGFSDTQNSVDVSGAQLFLDGEDVTPQTSLSAVTAQYQPSSPLFEGVHELRFLISDSVGNRAGILSNFSVDSSSPTAMILVNPSYPLKSGNPVVSLTASEPLKGQQLEFIVNGQAHPVPLISAGTLSWSGSFVVDGSMNGSAQWMWRGTDLSGNEGQLITSGNQFTIDTIPPSASITVKPSSTLSVGVSQITLTASEAVQSANLSYEIANHGNFPVPLIQIDSQTWTGAITIAPNSNAYAALWHWAGTDLAGNSGNSISGSQGFEIDTLPPIGNVRINGGADYATSTLVTLNFTATDFTGFGRGNPSAVLISLDGGATYSETPFVSTMTLVLPLAGGYPIPKNQGVFKQVYVKFKDAAGNLSDLSQAGIIINPQGPPKSAVILRKK